MTPVSDELIELRGLRFHYRDWAPAHPALPTLVLLHGFTGHSRYWDFFAPQMTDRYRVLALDQRGHGESAWAAPDAYGNDDMTDDLRAFVAAMGLQAFSLLGLSMGGMVGIRYAGERPPAALKRLVIVDIGPEIAPAGLARITSGAHASDVFDSLEAAFELAKRGSPIVAEHRLEHRTRHALMRTADGRWTWRYDRTLRDPKIPRKRLSPEDGWRFVAGIQVPTLIVRGERTDVFPIECAERMARDIADAKLVEVRGAGHSVALDQPEGFLQAVRAFL